MLPLYTLGAPSMPIEIHPFVLGDYQTNCHVVTADHDCWIVDCGYSPEELIEYVQEHALNPSAILLTHCHSDHIAGLDQLRNAIGDVPVHSHASEAEWNMNPMLNLSGLAGRPVTAAAPDGFLTPGKPITLGDTTWDVLHTPGHSPGSLCFVNHDLNHAIVGDTLFAGSIGRHDFPTSNVADLRHSIHEVIMQLPDEMHFYPGHGPSSTIGQERASNPFVINGF